MKKILSLLLVLIMLFSLASCQAVLDDVFKLVTGEESSSEEKEEDKDGYKYTDFSPSEKNIFTNNIGEIIPFIPNNEYYVEGYNDTDDYENGINFYTIGNTEAEFEAYKNSFVGYNFEEEYQDSYGDTWYYYTKGNLELDISYYYYEGEYYVDVYIKLTEGTTPSPNPGTDITNPNDPDTPSDTDGVRKIHFTDATIVKDVTDQGYYIDGCPTVGSPAVLVIPVEFSDAKASSLGYSTSVIADAFKKDGNVDYYSVYDYYYISSYGQLTLDVTVLDTWFRPEKSSTYYENYYEDGYFMGDQLILDEALAYLEPLMDLSKFDSDGNDVIDSVVLINTLDIDETDFHWAYRYWNYYGDEDGYYYEYDGVSANDYIWASYQFIFESYDRQGNVQYTDTTVRNTYTYIHEFGHILGSDDYYDTSELGNHPMDGCDVMDAMSADHSAFTKINYGWITTSRLVTTDTSVTLTLEDFSKSGDTIIIANNFDTTLGAYQEYYIVVYYTNNGLNSGDDYGLFSRDGIVVYHVNAALTSEVYDGTTYYDLANSNTDSSDEYGSVNNLVEFVKTSSDNYTYVAGDKLPSVTDDNGQKLAYTFTVNSLTSTTATITFTEN